MTRRAACAVVAAVAALGLTACDDINTVQRPTAPVVLTGADLPALVGAAPARIVAFRHARVDGQPQWTQIPVQVDQRKVVPFGSQPANNTTPGVAGTVYGSGSGGPTALQYADPNTFVGADANANFDADDELVFMVADAGGHAPVRPAHRAGGRHRRQRRRGAGRRPQRRRRHGLGLPVPHERWARPRGRAVDYVDYEFLLTSGDYKHDL